MLDIRKFKGNHPTLRTTHFVDAIVLEGLTSQVICFAADNNTALDLKHTIAEQWPLNHGPILCKTIEVKYNFEEFLNDLPTQLNELQEQYPNLVIAIADISLEQLAVLTNYTYDTPTTIIVSHS